MRKILIRANMLPFDNPDIGDVFRYNLFGNNMGNLIYQASVVRMLMTDDDVEFTAVKFNTPEVLLSDFDEINSTYDCFVIPLANAFRSGFMAELDRITKYIKQLKIPCYVIGVGAQASLDGTFPSMDTKRIKNFINAVLEHSSIIGLRGEVTGQYLKELGYKEEEDYTVIGCPSLFYYGDTLPRAEVKELTPDSRISVTRKNGTPDEFHRFINRQLELFPNHWFVPQTIEDFAVQYAGVSFTVANYPKGEGSPFYPSEYDDPIYRDDRAPTFKNFKTWIEFLRDKDFAFGSRIHGNIAPILAGVPAYVFPSDMRIKELVDYHNIPHTLMTEVKEDTDLFALYEKADFDGIHRGHKERFDRYVSFLKKNGIPNIFDGSRQYGEVPFDKKMAGIDFQGPEHSYCSLDEQGRRERMEAYIIAHKQTIKDVSSSRVRIGKKCYKLQMADKKKISLDESFSTIVSKAARRKVRGKLNKR